MELDNQKNKYSLSGYIVFIYAYNIGKQRVAFINLKGFVKNTKLKIGKMRGEKEMITILNKDYACSNTIKNAFMYYFF